jgi:pyridoxamine 5'-phosphate oxidase
VREFLRSLPVFAGVLTGFETDDAPARPQTLFESWLRDAVEAGVREPHAMTVSTVAPDGPDARVVILKDVDADGWWFASSSASAKGRELADRPGAALTFYWPEIARQVRIRGRVRTGTAEQGARDFTARGSAARAVALAGHESDALDGRAECLAAIDAAQQRLAADPALVPATWTVYLVVAATVEFWQADKDRAHHRLQYRAVDGGWERTLLWP